MGDGVMRLDKSISPSGALVGQEVTVNLVLSVNNAICPSEVVGLPLDVILVIDHSSSMSDSLLALLGLSQSSTDKMTAAKNAAIAFVQQMQMGIDQVGVVQFNGYADLLQTLSHDAVQIEQSIQGISSSGGTAIDAGLDAARDELQQNGRADSARVIVILSDGLSSADSAIKAADAAKSDGIRVISVGIGGDVDAALMESIASSQTDYHHSPDASDLQQIYVSIAQQIRQFAAATHVKVTHTFDAARIEPITNSISNGGALSGGTVRNIITWDMEKLGDQPQTLSYKARLLRPGEFYADVEDKVSYVLCESEPRAFVGDPALWVQVPTPVPTATATNSPTPRVTATYTLTSSVWPTRPPTATPDIWPTIVPPSGGGFCASRNWWIPALLFPLLLALLVFLLLWWWSRRNHVAWYNLWKEWKPTCRVMSVLLLLYLLFLTFLIGREIFAGLCTKTEAVYFWRMDRSTGQYGIYLTRFEEGARAVSFDQVNSYPCVGCHAVSSSSRQIAAVVGPMPGDGIVYSLGGKEVSIPGLDAAYYGWSPDGQRLAYADSIGDIYILDLQSGSVQPLAGASDPGISETMPAWTHDGQSIAFVRSQTPIRTGGASLEGTCDLYLVSAAGGQAAPIAGASGDGFNYYPSFSPDGRWLAFTRHTTGVSTYSDSAAEIYLVAAGGGEAKRLAANDAAGGAALLGVSNSWPTWSRNGQWLAFNSKRNDPAFDVFLTEIDESGNSGPAIPLPGASEPGIFEHTPFWGVPLEERPLMARLLDLWPFLLPLLLLALLRWLFCRGKPVVHVGPIPPAGDPVLDRKPVEFQKRLDLRLPKWDPAPTLVIGLGGSGRWALTHLKKNLAEAECEEGESPVRLLLLDTSPQEVVGGQDKPVRVGNVELAEEEKLIVGANLRDLITSMARDRRAEPEMQSWFPAAEYVENRHLADAQMDIRRTTSLRRPMGRAVVFQDIHQCESSRIWQRLSRAVGQFTHQGQVRVMIVGSICGGFGSAAFADAAYLVRRAVEVGGRREAGAIISAFLITDGPFGAQNTQIKLNAGATLREMSRLLLARGRPFPMVYNRDWPNTAFAGHISWSLFDDVFLLDGRRPNKPLDLVQPEQGMFPLVADLMTALVDRGSQLVEQVRANMRTDAADEQVRTGEPVVSTIGGYTYHLPMQDLVRALRLRFAHDLVRLVLGGPSEQDEALSLAEELCQDRYEDGLDQLAADLLRATIKDPTRRPPPAEPVKPRGCLFRATSEDPTVRADAAGAERGLGAGGLSTYVADLAQRTGHAESSAAMDGIWHAIVAQAAAHGDSGETLLKENIVQFRQALASLLLRLVNGHPAENDVVKARTAKLGYARAFLQTLAQTIERAGQNLALARSQAAAEADTGCALLAEFIHRQEAALKEESESLDKTIVFLAGDPERTARARQGEAMGVLDDLRELVLREKEWRAELGRIPVRKTLADEGLLNQMYTDYFAPAVVEQGLERLYWRAGEKGKLELVVRHQQDVAFAPEASNKAKFIEALLELAENVGQEVWKLELGPILDDPDTGLWVAPSARREVGEAAAWAEPAATVQVGKAREQLPHRYLWANRTIGRADDYAREVQLQAAAQSGVQSLVATHPYRAMLITTLDVVPLSALDCTARLGELYLSTFIRPPAENRVNLEPVHVFAAERNSLSYEQRLRELAEAPRRFHPLFVAALEDLERARWFALAYAVGWVQTVQVREGGDWRQQYVLRLEGQQERKLTRPDDPGNPVALLVRAMQGFVLGDDPSAEVDPAHPVEEAVQAVRMIIEERVASSEERLDSFARTFSAATLNDRRAGAQDLASFVRLVVHDEIRAIRERSMRGGG